MSNLTGTRATFHPQRAAKPSERSPGCRGNTICRLVLQRKVRKAVSSPRFPTKMSRERPETMAGMDERDNMAWVYSFSAAMVPFTAFCIGHSKGMTVRVVEAVVRSPVGVYGLLALPFITLGMEKSVYDTVQAWQGIDPNIRPKNRGGFPSGGAELPSFSLIPVRTKASSTVRTEEDN